ncbi:MAG: MFS transporter [Candidatus Lernaella stagnicola]|nr:MFS transporter [Candidatus Lernaella stagnicola]
MTDSQTAPAGKSSRYRYFVFALLFFMYMFDYMDRMVVSSLLPDLKREWGITDAQSGMLLSLVYLSIVATTFPISLLVDRWSRRKSIAIMGMIWSTATGACAFASQFMHLAIAKSIIGVGEAGYATGGTAMLSGLFPEKKRAQIMGFWNMSIPLGAALGIAMGGIVAATWGWRYAFGLVAIPGFIVSMLFFFVKDYKTVKLVRTAVSENGVSAEVKMNWKDIALEFLKNPTLLFTYFGFAANVFLSTSMMFWMSTYFQRTQGLAQDAAGLKTGAVLLMAIIGAPLGGFLADKWRNKQNNARSLFAAVSSAFAALVLFIAFMYLEGSPAQFPTLMLGGIAVVAFLPGAAAVTQDVVHPGLRAVSYSLCVIVQNLLGSALGPPMVGHISDTYDIQTAMALLPLAFALAALLHFIAAMFYNRDFAKVEKVELDLEE